MVIRLQDGLITFQYMKNILKGLEITSKDIRNWCLEWWFSTNVTEIFWIPLSKIVAIDITPSCKNYEIPGTSCSY